MKHNRRRLAEAEDDAGNSLGVKVEINGRSCHDRDASFSTIFEVQPERGYPTPMTCGTPRCTPWSASGGGPERKIILFALHLAILEKAASGIGQLAFVWATVVLLGGFADVLRGTDFCFITAILVVEGARIFSRSHEFEWQHRSTRTLPPSKTTRTLSAAFSLSRSRKLIDDKLRGSIRDLENASQNLPIAPKRPPLVAAVVSTLVSEKISCVLHWLQLLAAASCGALSLLRLYQQSYGDASHPIQHNQELALNMFYALALVETLMFLFERAYWTYRIRFRMLFERVCEECDFRPRGIVAIRRFFYDAYSKCVDGSIFDGLKMNLVSFAEELLDSDSPDEQLNGAMILRRFVYNVVYAPNTLRKIGTSASAIERLLEMVNRKDTEEKEIRLTAAEIIAKLAAKKQSALRLAAIPGAMESISSLLYTGEEKAVAEPYEAELADRRYCDLSALNLLGLRILKNLSRDSINCWNIGSTKSLLPRVIDLTSGGSTVLRDVCEPEWKIKTVRRAMQVVWMLVSATGLTGKKMRREVGEIVYSVSHLRDVLRYGENHMKLRKIAVEILTSLAMDDEARERIGVTGGMFGLLLGLFFGRRSTEEEKMLCREAGEALAMLLLESEGNCKRLLREGEMVLDRLVAALSDVLLREHAGRILLCLFTFAGPESSAHLRVVAGDAMSKLLQVIMEVDEKKVQQVSIGLVAHLLRTVTPVEHRSGFERAGVKPEDFSAKLVRILRRSDYPEAKVPRLRRFAIELLLTLMRSDPKYVALFEDLGTGEALRRVAETTSELECYTFFSGSTGLGRINTTIFSLVDEALQLLAGGSA